MKLLVLGYGLEAACGVYDTESRGFTVKTKAFSNLSFCTPGPPNTIIGVVEEEPASKICLLDKVTLEVLDIREINGGALCHVAYLAQSGLAVGSCYGDGKIFSLGVKGGRFFGEPQYISQGGRAHGAFPTAHESAVFTANIAMDSINRYEPEPNGAGLKLAGSVSLPEGCGPRHIWPLSQRGFWVITEYSNELIFIEDERIKWVLSTLPEDFSGKSYGSSLVIWKGFLYGANRGADLIVCYDIRGAEPTLAGFFSSGGHFPRHMAMVGGNILAVANQGSNNLSLIPLEAESGAKKEEPESIEFPGPSCIFEMED